MQKDTGGPQTVDAKGRRMNQRHAQTEAKKVVAKAGGAGRTGVRRAIPLTQQRVTVGFRV